MIINSLSVEGFRTIGNKIQIQFPKEGIIGIFGHNEAGKSTFLDAIEFALFGLAVRGINKEDRITWGKNRLQVKLNFTCGEKTYQIERMLAKHGTSHKVKLVQMENGIPVRDSEITSIGSVEETVEELIGMDKNSYSKLIYIRQKELDALKDLQKQDREQLINKVMGIDIFDEATQVAVADRREENRALETVKTKLDGLKKNYESYQEKLKEKNEIELKISELEPQIDKLEKCKKDLNDKLKKYQWLNSYNSKKAVLDSKRKVYADKIENFEKLKNFQAIIQKYKPKLDRLYEIYDQFVQKETELSYEKTRLADAESTLPKSYSSPAQLTKKRSSSLKTGIVLLVAGLALAVLGMALIYPAIFGIILAGTSGIYFKRYKTFDKELITNVGGHATAQSIDYIKRQINIINQEIESIRHSSGKNSSKEIREEINRLNSEIEQKTGYSSIEKLQGVEKNLQTQLDSFNEGEFSDEINSLKKEIDDLEVEMQTLEEEKPSETEHLDVNEFKSIQLHFEEVSKELKEKYDELSGKKAIKDQLVRYCKDLEEDYLAYPKEVKQKEKIEEKIRMLGFVIDQFKLVAENMRSKVIPQARYEINQMLPMITGNRYSAVEIDEELELKVYTQQTGGYKERELFSGGTQDQFLIALRLAFTKSILNSRISADEYCLFMDETISSSDEARKIGIFDLLKSVKNTFKQIFIISHEDISDVVDHHLVLQSGTDGLTTIKSMSW